MAMQLGRAREFAVLRANGMNPGQIGWLVSLQTGFMGFVAGLLLLPLGPVLAGVLVFEVNKRAFGWTLPYSEDAWILFQALALTISAAALAGVYPILRMARSQPAAALRAELVAVLKPFSELLHTTLKPARQPVQDLPDTVRRNPVLFFLMSRNAPRVTCRKGGHWTESYCDGKRLIESGRECDRITY